VLDKNKEDRDGEKERKGVTWQKKRRED